MLMPTGKIYINDINIEIFDCRSYEDFIEEAKYVITNYLNLNIMK